MALEVGGEKGAKQERSKGKKGKGDRKQDQGEENPDKADQKNSSQGKAKWVKKQKQEKEKGESAPDRVGMGVRQKGEKGRGKGQKGRSGCGEDGKSRQMGKPLPGENRRVWDDAAGNQMGRSRLNTSAPGFTPGMPSFWNASLVLPALQPVWFEYADKDGTPYYWNSQSGLTQWEKPSDLEPPKAPAAEMNDRGAGKGGEVDAEGQRRDAGSDRATGGGGQLPDRRQERMRKDKGKGKGKGSGKRKEESDCGPPGCNLFVFHLPDDWTDEDLLENFMPHGTVISAKVMKEPGTDRSRGFGFVSYEDREGAARAVNKMQGYKILGKRLKVEIKRGEHEDDEEYDRGGGAKRSSPREEPLIGYLREIAGEQAAQSSDQSAV